MSTPRRTFGCLKSRTIRWEYLREPEMFTYARRLLVADGQILVRIPTVMPEAFEIYRKNWVNLDTPIIFSAFARKPGDCGIEGPTRACSFVVQFVGSAVHGEQTTYQRCSSYGSMQRCGEQIEGPFHHGATKRLRAARCLIEPHTVRQYDLSGIVHT